MQLQKIIIPNPRKINRNSMGNEGFKSKMKRKFLEGWGGGSNQKTFPKGGMDVFWNNAIRVRRQKKLRIKLD